MILTSSDAGANGVTWFRQSCCTSVYYTDLRNAVVLLIVPLASCDAYDNASGVT